MDAKQLLTLAPVDWQRTVEAMSMKDREKVTRELQGIAERAAMLATYVDTRSIAGTYDNGHDRAIKAANQTGQLVWCKGFGYNAHHGVTV